MDTMIPSSAELAGDQAVISRAEKLRPIVEAASDDIEDRRRIDPALLDKLHEEGLVDRRAHPTDRRVRTLWLTPAARPVVERILAINEAIRREAFSGLPPRTCDALIDVLSQIKDKLALKEEVACDRSNDGSHEEGPSASGN